MNDNEGKSTSGYAIRLFGDLISWRTKRQTHVALSSAEAEFVAMSVASKELKSVNEMNKRILLIPTIPTMYEDNKAAIRLATIEESQTFKHVVNLCYHFVRSEVQSKRLRLEWISTKDQLGDFFTKALPKPLFIKFRNELMCDTKFLQNTSSEYKLENDNN